MSGDVMEFPKTVEEFMEKYKIVDSEQVYTNGAELVPIFRMKQWVEHLRHGKWTITEVFDFKNMTCSSCGWLYEYHAGMEEEWNYCPHCGARMDLNEVEK